MPNLSSSTSPRILLAGCNGPLGHELDGLLRLRGYQTFALTRQAMPLTNHIAWDASTSEGSWTALLEGADAVVSLLGYSRDPADMERRVVAMKALGSAIRNAARAPQIWIQASSLDYYGKSHERVNDETSGAGTDRDALLTAQWENTFHALDLGETHRCLLRLGTVLAPGLGQLKRRVRRTQLFLGSHLGLRKHYLSWVHIHDLQQMFLTCIQNRAEGIYNATSPIPAGHDEMMRELRRILRRPWSPPLPGFLVTAISGVLGVEPEMALKSRRCVPARFLREGFQFRFSDLAQALDNVLRLK